MKLGEMTQLQYDYWFMNLIHIYYTPKDTILI